MTEITREWILLKFGSLKDWIHVSPDNKVFFRHLEEYCNEGVSESLAFHRDSLKQKEILCHLIDDFEGEIFLDGGGLMTKDQAKEYVNTY